MLIHLADGCQLAPYTNPSTGPDSSADEDPRADQPFSAAHLDRELYFEQRIGKVVAANKILEDGNDELQAHVEELERQMRELKRENVRGAPFLLQPCANREIGSLAREKSG